MAPEYIILIGLGSAAIVGWGLSRLIDWRLEVALEREDRRLRELEREREQHPVPIKNPTAWQWGTHIANAHGRAAGSNLTVADYEKWHNAPHWWPWCPGPMEPEKVNLLGGML